MNRNLEDLPPGTVVSVSRGLYRHVGLLAEIRLGAPRTVISLNPGLQGAQVREETLAEFARGNPVVVEELRGPLPGHEVLRRARSGSQPVYGWSTFNCEHFVRFAHGLVPESPQAMTFTVFAALAGLLYVARTSRA